MFITLLERVMEQTECNTEGTGVNIHGRILKDLRYADDVDLMAETENGLQGTAYVSGRKQQGLWAADK